MLPAMHEASLVAELERLASDAAATRHRLEQLAREIKKVGETISVSSPRSEAVAEPVAEPVVAHATPTAAATIAPGFGASDGAADNVAVEDQNP